MYSFTAHERGVSAVSFSPRVPGMLATCSEDKTVRVWDVDAEVPLQVCVALIQKDGVCLARVDAPRGTESRSRVRWK